MSKETDISESLMESVRAVKMGDVERTPAWKKKWWDLCFWWEDHNPFDKYVEVPSYDEYVNLPYHKRTFLLFWYHRPLLGSSTGFCVGDFLGKKQDRESVDAYLQYKFPVQYYLREKLYYKIVRGYDKLRYFLNPRQKWLVKQIPNEWTDKVTLIKDINFAMVMHFVDGEKCFEYTDYVNSGEHHAKFARELMECYLYIKIRRPDLEKQYWAAYPEDDKYTGDYETDYGAVHRLEKELDDQDKKWLNWIIDNRKYFWT